MQARANKQHRIPHRHILLAALMLLASVVANSSQSYQWFANGAAARVACEASKGGGYPTHPSWPGGYDCNSVAPQTTYGLVHSYYSWCEYHTNDGDIYANRCSQSWGGPVIHAHIYAYLLYSNAGQCPIGLIPGPGGECIANQEEQGNSCPAQNGETNPINLGVGNKFQTEVDYLGGGVFPLTVSRTYNSLSREWQQLIEVVPNATVTEATVVRPDGKGFTFSSDGSGGWVADPNVTGTLASFDDGQGNITGWRYTTLDNQIEDYDASGRITAITHRSGISHTYSYTTTDITVTHSEGDVLTYQLNASGRITGFTDPDNNQYTYSYDMEGRLTGIAYPNNGGTRTYHYEKLGFPNLLTGITDANGDRFATWEYDAIGLAISSEHNGGADKVTAVYSLLYDNVDPRVTVTNPLGKQTTYHFTTIHGVRKVTQVEGHQSNNCAAANKAYTYDVNGFLETKTDWQGNVTRYTRNTKGQELSRIEAEGTPEERTITTEWHGTFNVPTKVTELGKETTFTYDADGNQLSKVVTDTSGP